ncbi:hypothetical protein ZWY2020_011363 [Hordeum vulgare]|nr:hypothetical protein ZWY2020_011363 [Hordeum vulgare]
MPKLWRPSSSLFPGQQLSTSSQSHGDTVSGHRRVLGWSVSEPVLLGLRARRDATVARVMALPTAVVAGVAASVAALVLLAVAAALCWWRLGARRSRTSDTASDETPPTLDMPCVTEVLIGPSRVGQVRPHVVGAGLPGRQAVHAGGDVPRHKNFSDANLVGAGTFGKVYMGLLLDGTVVAIKRRVGPPRQDFVDEVRRQSEIWHRNVVTLIGYCQDGGLEMLVFEHLPNSSVCGHLYDTGKESMTRLEFKQRLSIAIGAAKGLDHLHSLAPPLIHKVFNTSNVLVNENFIAKVSDTEVDRLLRRLEDPGSPLNGFSSGVYQDPDSKRVATCTTLGFFFSSSSVVGRPPAWFVQNQLNLSLIGWRHRETGGGPEAWWQLHLGGHEGVGRPDVAVSEPVGGEEAAQDAVGRGGLDRILEKEMTLTTVMGDGTAIITLGSQLFTS